MSFKIRINSTSLASLNLWISCRHSGAYFNKIYKHVLHNISTKKITVAIQRQQFLVALLIVEQHHLGKYKRIQKLTTSDCVFRSLLLSIFILYVRWLTWLPFLATSHIVPTNPRNRLTFALSREFLRKPFRCNLKSTKLVAWWLNKPWT